MVIRGILGALFFCAFIVCTGQPGLYRQYPHTPTGAFGTWWDSNPQGPVSTADGGFLLSNWEFVLGRHGPGGLAEGYTIKVDSNLIPQWKKGYAKAVSLPTGGTILFHHNRIEKVTASGVQVWIKYLSVPVMLNDAVIYRDKIRFVGNYASYTHSPGSTGNPLWTSDGFTLLTDTSGNFISSNLFHSSMTNYNWFWPYRGSAEFSGIERDGQGNFIVFSSPTSMTGLVSDMSVAKFDSSFTFVWAKTWNGSNHNTYINDIEFLANGEMLASGSTAGGAGPWANQHAALFRIDQMGNLTGQVFFEDRLKTTPIRKTANGKFIISLSKKDSLFMLETDSSLGVSWFKFQGKGSAVGGSVIKNNTLYSLRSALDDLVMVSTDLSGTSCSSYSMGFSSASPSVSLINFTLSPVSYPCLLISGTVNVLSSQSYIDSCKCPVFIPLIKNNVCVGDTAKIAVMGTGNLSWYNAAIGPGFIQSGSQFIYSSSTPTAFTVYAQDSACTANPHRTPVSIMVHATPTLTFLPDTPAICKGQSVFVTVQGAPTYSWSHGLQNSYMQNLHPVATTIYTVVGSAAQGCTDTKTLAVIVVPAVTVTALSSGSTCLGRTATLSASGGITYSWSEGQNGQTISVNPTSTGTHVYHVVGSNGVCTGSATATINVIANPTLSVIPVSTTICSGQTVALTAYGATSYSWSTGFLGPTHTVGPSSSTIFLVTGITNGCSAIDSVVLTVTPLPKVIVSQSASTVCIGSQATFSASGAQTYSWSTGAVGSLATASAAAGLNNFVVTGFNSNCSDSTSIQIVGVPVPTVSIFSYPAKLCEGMTATLIAGGAPKYTWSTGSTTNTATLTAFPNVALSVNGANGSCVTSKSILLNVLPSPVIYLTSQDSVVCAGEQVILNASGALTYSWNTGISGATLTDWPTASTNYIVWGFNKDGCSTAGSFMQLVDPCLGVDNMYSSQSNINIFPNPHSSSFVVTGYEPFVGSDAELISSEGKVVLRFQLSAESTKISTLELAAGLYLLRVGHKTVKRIIRE